MLEFFPKEYLIFKEHFLAVRQILRDKIRQPGLEPETLLQTTLQDHLPKLIADLERIGFKVSLDQARKLKRYLEVPESQRPPVTVLTSAMMEFFNRIEYDCEQRLFFVIPEDVQNYYRQPLKGWETVAIHCKEAVADIEEAAKCYVLDRPTAAVFHIMRVAEHGLRHLAKRLHVQLTHAGRKHPIEFADWDKVITGIKNKIATVRQLPHGARRQAQLELYSDAADHCDFMKDIWRNNISHARRPCKLTEAMAVFERVRDFMTFLSKAGRSIHK
jgi:hypothetical protein